MPKNKKKSKKNRKKIKKTKPIKKLKKSTFKSKKIGRRRKRTRKVRKKKKKLKIKSKIKLPKIRLKKPKFNLFKKISFQGTVNWLLEPIFRGWDNYLERKRRKQIQRMEFERKERIRQKKEAAKLRLEQKKKELQQEKKIEIERKKDLHQFILLNQAILRAEQADEKRKVYEAMKIQRKLDQYAKREAKEISELEKISLHEHISEYSKVQESIDKIRARYAEIRESRFRKSYEEMGIDVLESDTREDLYEKHRIFEEQRKRVEQVLESFFRSTQSLIFQLNRRWIPKNLEIMRVIDRRWEENLFYIRLDNAVEDNFLSLIYLKDGNLDKPTIVVEDKTSEKYITKEFSSSSVFTFSDFMVDRYTQYLDRAFKKKKAS